MLVALNGKSWNMARFIQVYLWDSYLPNKYNNG